jgi:LAO/AO transport system kinase
MGTFYNHDSVFIRSIATRGSLGGLSAKAVEITDIMRSFGFDHIIVETVGVGQSEVEIAGLADTTALVLVPESGDEVQAIKSGIMEIADIFVINKADRKGAELLEKNLNQLLNLYSHKDWLPPIIKTIATDGKGVTELIDQVKKHQDNTTNERKYLLLAEKAYSLIQNRLMKPVSKSDIQLKIQSNAKSVDFNLYDFVENWIKSI